MVSQMPLWYCLVIFFDAAGFCGFDCCLERQAIETRRAVFWLRIATFAAISQSKAKGSRKLVLPVDRSVGRPVRVGR